MKLGGWHIGCQDLKTELQLANRGDINWDEREVVFKTYVLRRKWGYIIE